VARVEKRVMEKLERMMLDMVDDGLLNMVLRDDGEFAFTLTEKGRTVSALVDGDVMALEVDDRGHPSYHLTEKGMNLVEPGEEDQQEVG
jgi:predicted transcriptional regulator